jgi:phage N-6-adenine-methyltransferase
MNQLENDSAPEAGRGDHGCRPANPVRSNRSADQAVIEPSDSLPKSTGSARNRVHFASRTDEWATPLDLFERLDREFRFTLDPCSTHENAKCRKHFTRAEDGLIQDWSREVVFMNPPYGREIGHWMRKAYESAELGATVVCLVPARTDTRWWHAYAVHGKIIYFKGRLKFGSAKSSAPFPSALVIFGAEPKSTRRRGRSRGPSANQISMPF